jgi:hypothetical protein
MDAFGALPCVPTMNRPEPRAPLPPSAPSGSGNALPVGHRLHEFEIEGLIGEGGFGSV